MNRKTLASAAVAGFLGASAAVPAFAKDWEVYAEASASAYVPGGPVSGEVVNTECNGTRATLAYCGPSIISPTKTNASQTASSMASSAYGYGTVQGHGFASADLATGELKIITNASGFHSELTSGGASTQLIDTVHFNLESNLDLVPITVDIRLDGRTYGYTQPQFGFYAADAVSILGAGIHFAGIGVTCTNAAIQSPCDSQAQISAFEKQGSWTTFDPDHLVGTFYVDSAHPDVSILMYLGAGGSTEYGDTFTEFGHTAALQLELPQGVTYTSDSGVFLTSVPASAPEPATWTLMLIGFGLIGGAARRQKAARAF